IVLDLMLPGTYGMDLLKKYRATSEVPVLILSARDDTADKIRGLKLGADDYVTKPFFPEELIARIQACLRRPNFVETTSMKIGAIHIDLEGRQVRLEDTVVSFTQVEFDIVALLARRKGSAVSRDAIVDAVLDAAHEGSRRTLDVHISRIRSKLGDASAQLETVWGIGYRLGDRA
ncbi:MAG: response regulator transcription factor, partial [Polyangiales bacterium]